MATIKAKKGDSYSKLSKNLKIPEEDLRAANPGVKTLKSGQIINKPKTFTGNAIQSGQAKKPPALPQINVPLNIPQLNMPAPVRNQPQIYMPSGSLQTPKAIFNTPVAPITRPTVPSITAPPVSSTRRGTPTVTGGQSQEVVVNQFGTAGMYSMNQPQPFLGSSSYLDPRFQTQEATVQPAQPVRPPKDSVYTGDPEDPSTAQWISYWNFMATLAKQNPVAYQAELEKLGISTAPRVQTREEIRAAKIEQRRKEEAQKEGDTSSSTAGYVPQQGNTYKYPEAVQRVVWGI